MKFTNSVNWPDTDGEAARVDLQQGDDASYLLAHARQGDRHCIGELLQHYRNYLLLLATGQIGRRLQARLSASDLVQEVMLKAHRNFASFQGRTEQELLAWLRQILLNSLTNFLEQHVLAAKRDVRKEVPIDGREAHFEANNGPLHAVHHAAVKTPSVHAQDREEAVLLADRLAQLPPQYREVLVLRNIQGLSFDEAAAKLNRSLGATRMLWLRAIEKLRVVYQRAEEQDGQ